MPAKLSEIAEQCGVTRQTVNNYLRKMGLWDEHVTPGAAGKAAIVDDFAASAVVAKIGVRKFPAFEPSEDGVDADLPANNGKSEEDVAILSAHWREIVAALRQQITDLQEERKLLQDENERLRNRLDEKDQRIGEMDGQIATYLTTIKKLPSADAVSEAKTAGEAEERRKIASMGFFERRRYLRGGR